MANNPIAVSIKEKRVTKVATNVTSGNINKNNKTGRDWEYLVSYRLTGQTAPSEDEIKSEGMIMFQDNPEQETISSTAAIDIYVYANKEDGKTDFTVLWIWT